MAELTCFKNDNRISPDQRKELRAFSGRIGGEIVELANRLGVSVKLSSLRFEESGYIEYAPSCGSESGYRIVVNEDHSPVRQRFTVAHELAHFVLHRRNGNMDFRTEQMHRFDTKRDYRSTDLKAEFEADVFASLLLMPPALVRVEAARGNLDLVALSRRFDVSVQAMTVRLKQLGIRAELVGRPTRLQELSDPSGLLGWRKPRHTKSGGAVL